MQHGRLHLENLPSAFSSKDADPFFKNVKSMAIDDSKPAAANGPDRTGSNLSKALDDFVLFLRN
jgi:hypothetical protein